jgi:poly(3-hydroxyalkanoate) synthetase
MQNESSMKFLSPLSAPPAIPVAAKAMESNEFGAKKPKLADEKIEGHGGLRPTLATPCRVRLDTRIAVLRDYGHPGGLPTLVHAPYSGQSSMIADFYNGQSLVQTILANGIGHVVLTDWKSATKDMKDLDIDNYLAGVVVAIDDLGGRVNLIGLSEGGWVSAMIAARFPDKVNSLVLAGAPIDTDAGDGPLKRMVHELPASFYENLVAAGDGLMQGRLMVQGWRNLHPKEDYFRDHVDLYGRMDETYPAKKETFDCWCDNPIDLPGRWYLQVVTQLFKENRLAKGEFVALGRKLDLHNITCPVYLLAGAADDITPPEQVLDAAKYLGTPKHRIVQKIVPGGHLGLFMGATTLDEHWPPIARWIAAQ